MTTEQMNDDKDDDLELHLSQWNMTSMTKMMMMMTMMMMMMTMMVAAIKKPNRLKLDPLGESEAS